MALIANNVVVGKKTQPSKQQKVETFDDVKFSLKQAEHKKKREQKQRLSNTDLPPKPKKRDNINKRKQESQFLSVMKNKE
jgi:hypothetical protein